MSLLNVECPSNRASATSLASNQANCENPTYRQVYRLPTRKLRSHCPFIMLYQTAVTHARKVGGGSLWQTTLGGQIAFAEVLYVSSDE